MGLRCTRRYPHKDGRRRRLADDPDAREHRRTDEAREAERRDEGRRLDGAVPRVRRRRAAAGKPDGGVDDCGHQHRGQHAHRQGVAQHNLGEHKRRGAVTADTALLKVEQTLLPPHAERGEAAQQEVAREEEEEAHALQDAARQVEVHRPEDGRAHACGRRSRKRTRHTVEGDLLGRWITARPLSANVLLEALSLGEVDPREISAQ